jgi:hypothetical protein
MIIPTIRDVDVSATGNTTSARPVFARLTFMDAVVYRLTHSDDFFADLYYPFTIKDLHPDSMKSHFLPVVSLSLVSHDHELMRSCRQAY